MAPKAFASSADLAEKAQTLEILADGVYALTAEGDPNVEAIEGEDFLVCAAALAAPGEVWVIRPDAHAAAVLHDPGRAQIAAALRRALGLTEAAC
jgi:hypothetical protein